MSKVQEQLVVCDQCGGAIPSGADCIAGVSGTLTIQGTQTPFTGMDFCCTEHMMDWVGSKPQVVTPDPLYSPPPAQ